MYQVFRGNKLVFAHENHRVAQRYAQKHHGCRVVFSY